MSGLDEAADVKAPVAGGTIRVTVTSTVARFAIPSGFDGVKCNFIFDVAVGSEPAECDINFGGSTVTCVKDQASTVNTEAITVHTSSGPTLRSGVTQHWTMPSADRATHFAVDVEAGVSGTLVITKS